MSSSEASEIAVLRTPSPGYVDFFGYHAVSGGWVFCGWIPRATQEARGDEASQPSVRVAFEGGNLSGNAIMAAFHRDDLGDRGIGVVLYVASSGRFLGKLTSLELLIEDARYRLVAAAEAPQLREIELVTRLRPILNGAASGAARSELTALLGRRAYNGQDTLAALSDQVMLEVDEAILCPPSGLVLMGWYLAAPGALASIRVRSGINAVEIRPEDWIRIERADVIDSVGRQKGHTDLRCGFLAYVPDVVSADDPIYIEVETQSREIGFKNVPPRRLHGMSAVRRMLDAFELQYAEVAPAFDRILGPALAAINTERLLQKPRVTELVFGNMSPRPRYTVIVPLYGRMDYMEYQIGLMSAHDGTEYFELIYVLDDPPKRRELELLADSVHRRFAVPFRLLLLDRNVGFAPANNIGLAHARGEFICFLNSDVFPGTPDWLERLVHRLETTPKLGAVGPLLLFEDGSVQHEGMEYELLTELGDFPFPLHARKGWRPVAGQQLVIKKMITGACMVMRRSLAQELGGFDEAYMIGDFEDCDLCWKIDQRELTCAVDHEVQLYHLERKSQVGPGQRWRMNLTLYNAWLHQDRWFPRRAEVRSQANG